MKCTHNKQTASTAWHLNNSKKYINKENFNGGCKCHIIDSPCKQMLRDSVEVVFHRLHIKIRSIAPLWHNGQWWLLTCEIGGSVEGTKASVNEWHGEGFGVKAVDWGVRQGGNSHFSFISSCAGTNTATISHWQKPAGWSHIGCILTGNFPKSNNELYNNIN